MLEYLSSLKNRCEIKKKGGVIVTNREDLIKLVSLVKNGITVSPNRDYDGKSIQILDDFGAIIGRSH